MARCPQCSSEAPEGSRFCPSCAAPLDATSALTETSAPTVVPTPAPHGASPGPTAVTSDPALEGARFVPGALFAGRYRMVGLLGKGGMGEVYRADDLKLGQPVALKFLPQGLERDPERLSRFLNEVRTARQVTHPNVCRVYDLADVDGHHYLSMEYVDGEDLSSLLRRIGRLPEDKAVQIARQLCAGVQAAHEQGILHRDLKPANVMIDGRGQVKITDFGLAGLAEGFEGAEVMSGTPAYMAPEQLAGKEVTHRSDLYSLGLVLYELFTGKVAFEASSRAELVQLQQDSSPTSPSSHVEGLDEGVEKAILRCLELEPGDRPASALALAAILPGGDPLAAAIAAGETPSPEVVAAAGRTGAMNPVLALGLAVLAIALWAGMQYSWAALLVIRANVPLDKPPAVLEAQAREVIAKFGYTEPLHSDPVDSAIGFDFSSSILRWILKNDTSPDRWAQLAHVRPGAVVFWYRQAPMPLRPRPSLDVMEPFVAGPVELANPPRNRPGEIVVVLDTQGRLESFWAGQKRFSGEPAAGETPDWSVMFALAEMDMAAFTPVEPRYDARMVPEVRAAWVGTLPDFPAGPVRIEAGMSAGRVVLFRVLPESIIEVLAADPEPSGAWSVLDLADSGVTVMVLLFGGFLARRNLRRGRADRRGAMRIAGFVFMATTLALVLESHRFWSRDLWVLWWPMVGTGAALAGSCWVFYVALEPYARRVWPSILPAWSRLVSSATWRARDPQVGRSLLVGLIAAGLIELRFPVMERVLQMQGAPPSLYSVDWQVVLGQRYAFANFLGEATWALFQALGCALLLVAGRFFLRSKVAAVLLLGAALLLLFYGNAGDLLWALTGAVILVAVLIRFGLLACVFCFFFVGAGGDSALTTDWTAWHAQSESMVLFALLAGYGFWAATAGRPLLAERDG